MAQMSFESLRLCGLCALAALLAACGNQSGAPGDAAATTPAPASQESNAGSQPAKGATVAELLSSPEAQASVASESSPAQQGATTQDGGGAVGSPQGDADVEYARVVSVAPVSGPHKVCTDETVTEQRKPNDQHQVAGTVIGAIAGGVIGNQFGGGKGRTLATVGGAVGGGVVGKEVQKNHQGKDTVTHVVKRCRTVDDSTAGVALYDVVYAYQGQNFNVRLDHDPGDRLALPVRGVVKE